MQTTRDSKVPYPATQAGYGPASPAKGVLNVNKALGSFVRGALVAGIVLVTASSGWAQVAGSVVNDVGTAVPGARVEIWSAYPGGTILNAGSTNGAGAFSLPSPAPANFDLRVYKPSSGKPEFYPSVIRNLAKPVTNVLAILSPLGNVLYSPEVRSYWDTTSTYLGSRLKSGDVLEAFDPTGVLCGLAASAGNGGFMMYVVGDDGMADGIHEGPFAGETIDFKINGLPAQTPVVWFPLGNSQNHHLAGSSISYGVTASGAADGNGQQGTNALLSFQFTNTGSVTDSFSYSAAIPTGWLITYPVAKLPSVTLAAGASALVDILIQIPPGTPDQTVTVTFEASSRTQGTVAAGVTTDLSVTTPTDVASGDGGLLPSQFALAQNYPNPFNPETEISFSLRVAGHVRLEIFNLLGQSVTVLVDGYRPQGVSTVHWDAHDAHGNVVPTGIYFYRLTQDNQSQVRKMALLK
ncbi:MAG: T9SS type A sorting domain-containing protein [candidate division Zixibacteria bacterium]|nr:T9SS type A sorting domain-containing protein [candidate division Zixibacteria bacterium]